MTQKCVQSWRFIEIARPGREIFDDWSSFPWIEIWEQKTSSAIWKWGVILFENCRVAWHKYRHLAPEWYEPYCRDDHKDKPIELEMEKWP